MGHIFAFLLPQTNDSTALHLAAAGGHKDVVSVLIDNGASPTDENAVSHCQHCHFLNGNLSLDYEIRRQ